MFTLLSTTVPTTPANNFPADTCVNYIVKGTYKTTGNCPSAALQNKAVLTSGASVYKDSACVNVRYACTNANTIIITDSTFSNPGLLARYDTTSFYVAGRLYVNDSLTLASCTVKTKEVMASK